MLAPFAANLLLFGRVLRAAGVPVHHSRLLDAIRALEWIGVSRRDDVRATLLALLVHRQEDIGRFDEAFGQFFRVHDRAAGGPPLFSLGERPRAVVRASAGGVTGVTVDEIVPDTTAGVDRAFGAYSATGVSRAKDFADFSPAELEQARRVLEHLPWRLGTRRTRRWQARGRAAVDLRAVLRKGISRGEVLELQFRRRRIAPRPLVLLADVSGSMERYSRVMMHFAYGLARHVRHVEAFVFATTLTRLTSRVTRQRADNQLSAIIRRVADWGGGTRIGDCLHLFHIHWARRVMRHGPVVIIVSDGWDRGDPERLARELARLRRLARRVVWLNPLLGRADYEPLTRGMQAALPYIDDFLPSHNLASLDALAKRLSL